MRASSRPYGAQIGPKFSGKVKMMNFTVLPAPVYQWSKMWGANYSAARNLQWLQTAKAHGFNAVRIFTFGLPDDDAFNGFDLLTNDWPDMATMRLRAGEFAQQCRTVGLRLIITMGGNSTEFAGPDGSRVDASIPLTLAYLRLWDEIAFDIIMFVDLLNEMNIFGNNNSYPTTWASSPSQMRADLDRYVVQARKASRLPMTISVYTGTAGELASGTYTDIQYDLSLDLHDIHCYWPGPPTVADFAAFERRQKFLGSYIISEFGANQQNAGTINEPLLRQMGDIAARPSCLGLGLWAITPQGTGDLDFGFCSDVDGTAVRAEKAVHTATWPMVP